MYTYMCVRVYVYIHINICIHIYSHCTVCACVCVCECVEFCINLSQKLAHQLIRKQNHLKSWTYKHPCPYTDPNPKS